MKKVIAIAALICCSFVSFGQKQGDVAFHGNLNFNLSNDFGGGFSSTSTGFGIGAGASYFLIDNLSVGLGVGYNLNGFTGSSDRHQFSITPTVAYYIGICDNLYYRPTLSYSFGLLKSGSYSSSNHNINLAAGAFEYKFHDHFAIIANVLDLGLTLQSESKNKTFNLNFTCPSVGVVFYL